MRRLLILCCCLFTLCPAYAQWLQTTGVASLNDGNAQDARERAVSDAISQALMYSGLELSSVQTLTNGVLTQDQITLHSAGQVEQVHILEERQENDTLSVTIQLEVANTLSQCTQNDLVSQLAITRTALENPQQARQGQIFDIASAYSKQLFAIMEQADLALKPVAYFQQAFDVSHFFSRQYQFDQNVLDFLGTQTNSQYVLLSQITDISVGEQLNNNYAFWQSDSFTRYFNIEFALFNSLTFEKVWQQAYQAQAPWDFKKTARVDVHSGRFWQSQYGQKIVDTSGQAMFDINQVLACLPTIGTIQHIDGEQLFINLGKNNGLELGQTLTLAHKSHVITQQGFTLPRSITTLHSYRVEQVHQHSAVLSPNSKTLKRAIQINDLVELTQ